MLMQPSWQHTLIRGEKRIFIFSSCFVSIVPFSIAHGLQDVTAHARLIHDGPNISDPPKDWPIWAKFIFAFFSGFAPILWIAAFLAFISWRPLGEAPSNVYNLILGIALLIVIVVSSMFTFYQVRSFTHFVPSLTLN